MTDAYAIVAVGLALAAVCIPVFLDASIRTCNLPGWALFERPCRAKAADLNSENHTGILIVTLEPSESFADPRMLCLEISSMTDGS